MKHICWLDGSLYYRHDYVKGWQHYSTHPLKQPDHPILNGSKGYATMQYLLKQGYVYAK